MADVYVTEQEQVEQIKKWWKRNGLTVVFAVIVALIVLVCIQYFRNTHNKDISVASMMYDSMTQQVLDDQKVEARKTATSLIEHHKHTVYASLAALMLARDEVYEGNLAKAKSHLNWVLEHGHDASFKEAARLRLARVALEENAPQQALTIIDTIEDKGFTPAVWELKGDSYLVMGDEGKAREAYKHAIATLPPNTLSRPILNMKLSELGVD